MSFVHEWKLALGLPLPGRPVLDKWRDLPACPLSATARHVARVLSEHMNRDGDDCYPSGDLIARETGYTVSTVWKALNELERAGYVCRLAASHQHGKGGRNHPTLYQPTIPETVRETDAFRALTLRRSARNHPTESQKPSGRRTRGPLGHQEASSAPRSVALPLDDCMKCGRLAPLHIMGSRFVCAACLEGMVEP